MFCLTHLCISLFKNWKINTLSSKLRKLSWESLVFLSFEGSVFILQFLNNEMHKCVNQNIIVHFIIQELKNKHTFLKKYRNWESKVLSFWQNERRQKPDISHPKVQFELESYILRTHWLQVRNHGIFQWVICTPDLTGLPCSYTPLV